MGKFEGVADTLYIPLAARIYVSEHFPEYFYDERALSLKDEMPYDDIASKSSEYYQMAGACRFHVTDAIVRAFIAAHPRCNVVNVGCGFETSFYRIDPPTGVTFFEMDLPEVIEARRRVLGESEQEVLIAGDMFDFAWTSGIDRTLPTLVTVIGVFQYFEQERVIGFLHALSEHFDDVEVVFDAMTPNAIKYANNHIKKTGNTSAELHFSCGSAREVAEMSGLAFVGETPFFGDARRQLKGRLNPYTRIAMKVVDESGRRGFIAHLRG